MFSKSSRYYNLPDLTWTDPTGRKVVYKSVRLIPPPRKHPETMTLVGQSERLDLVAARTLGRSDFFWKLCDANLALDPFELIEAEKHKLWVPES